MSKLRSTYYPHKRVQLVTDGPSPVKQSMAAECDINNIMRKNQKTGLITHVNQHNGSYDNLIAGGDYHDHLNACIEAQTAFDTLPAQIRNQFRNDPGAFLEFVQDPENASELVTMGLAQPPAPDPDAMPPVEIPTDHPEPANEDAAVAAP